MNSLNRKLIRDLFHLRGQVIAVALVVACGVAAFVAMRSVYYSLLDSQDAYYRQYRFADVFANLKSAPEPLAARIRAIPGVASAETRIVANVTLDVPGVEEQRVNVIADFIGRDTPLGDGYRVEARIIIWETNEALKAPMNALFRSGQRWNSFVVENGIAKRREVESGHRAYFEVEVLNGLREGEIVIAHPSNLVADDVRVSVDKNDRKVQ